jgi:hypothetical protein
MKPKALILSPYYGGVDLEHIASIGRLIQRGWLQMSITGCALLDHAYGALVGMALKQNAFDVAIFIEQDIIFEPEEAEALVSTAVGLDSMVGAPCIIKNPRGKLMCSGAEATELRFGYEGRPVPCWGLPLGFTAIPIRKIRAVCDRYCPDGPCRADNGGDVWPVFGSLVQTAPDGHRELMTQDYSFCKRLDSIQCPRFLDTRRRIVHKGAYPYTVEDSCFSVPMIDDFRVRFVSPEQIEPVGVEGLDMLTQAGPVNVTGPSSCGKP